MENKNEKAPALQCEGSIMKKDDLKLKDLDNNNYNILDKNKKNDFKFVKNDLQKSFFSNHSVQNELLYKGGVPAVCKAPTRVYENKKRGELRTFSSFLKESGDFNGVLDDNIILLDIDDGHDDKNEPNKWLKTRDASNKFFNLVQALNINTRVVKTKKGLHFYFKNDGSIKQNFTHCLCSLGFTIDVKIGNKNGTDAIKVEGVTREIIKDFDPIGSGLATIPNWFKVFKTQSYNANEFKDLDTSTLKKGFRDDALAKAYVPLLCNNGLSNDTIKECVKHLNNFIICDPFSSDELYKFLSDEWLDKERETAKKYAKNDNKRPSLSNFNDCLDTLNIDIKFNTLTKEVETPQTMYISCFGKSYDMNTNLITNIRDVYENYLNKTIPKSTVGDYLYNHACKNAYNPVATYLDAIKWDQKDRFDVIFKALGVIKHLEQTLIKKWFVQCVAMAFNDNKKPVSSAGVLILSSKGGQGKSTFFEKLAVQREWYATNNNNLQLDNKDNLINLTSSWIYELGEIDAILKKNTTAFKNFITNNLDRIRLPYASQQGKYARVTSFCGTTNNDDVNIDILGARRTWFIRLNKIDKKLFNTIADNGEELRQLWGQAVELYKSDNRYYETNDINDQLENMANECGELLDSEEEIRELLNLDSKLITFVTATKLKDLHFSLSKYDAKTIGKALTKIVKANNLTFRVVHGVKSYGVPLKVNL